MNIFNKITMQSMKKSHTRTIVTVIGVVLSAALITAVTTFGVSLLNYMANGAAQKYGDWHVKFEDVDSSFAAKQASNDKVANIETFENIGYAKLDGGRNHDKPYFFIAGFSKKTFNSLPITLLSGRLPKNSGEIIVPGSVMTKSSVQFQVGETITLAVGDRMEVNKSLGQHDPYISGKETFMPKAEMTYTVVGICQTPHFDEDSAPGYTLITTADAADTADDLSLFVTLKEPHEVHAYAKSTAGSHTYILNNDVLRFMGLSDDPGDKVFNALLYSVGGIVVLIIMIGSIFLIYNSFNISLNERTHQFGILSSVGATAKQLRYSVLFEGLCISTIGIPIGVIVGIASIRLVIGVVAKNFANILYADVPLTLTVSAPAILAAVVTSMITILVSADIPARKAANTPVMDCIRQTNEVKIESKAVKISKLAEHIYGLEGTLALKNFKRNKKRHRSIVLSLVLSVVLFISTSAFVADLKQASAGAKEGTTYDIGFGTHDMNDSEMLQLYNKLKTADGVYESSYQVVMKYFCAAKGSDLSDAYRKSAGLHSSDETVNLPMTIQFLDDSTYLNIIKELGLSNEEYTGQNAKIIAVAKMQVRGNQEKVDQLPDVFTSSSMNFTITPETNGEPKTEHGQNVGITFVNIVPPDTPPMTETSRRRPYTFNVMAPYSLKEKLAPSDISPDIMVKGMTFQSKNPSQSVSQMKTMIEGAGITVSYIILNTSEMLDQNRNMIFIANVFAYTFIIMISLIAVANVFNTISTNIKLRRRELAMLRSVGMSDRNFNKMMCFECAFYGMRALLVGLPLAIIFSWLIYKGMVVGGAENIDFVFLWGSMAISVFSVLFVIFVTMMYAVSKIKKENIIDALRDDMT
ncbi:MAG: FtsX-like permease family protein [Clostridium sp.]|jgi:putative ABC transport system permease protein|uniref:ABC transporter permease n=1 Tax=Clostridium sp. TaxID=1506 RepID=UPI0025C5B34C|nr:ABC transporter permease [Clostridium sp.]MCH3964502.1 FtsX-like permease family protein [Clostridium sp.]MCI1714974.1 FtsX-like permease family protein [Clostridium sp.]MCI1799236.1 FtsX-like permease family protein [Clostridium sp.]MCI1813157.1 FtsX-like permease family protein [Clostridium sp.]MCI1870047.1 FtsX-like permease family protein [Clostridium sp.]